MRVIMLTDTFFASREYSMLQRLEVGLADEGVRIVHAVPDKSASGLGEGVVAHTVRYSTRTLAITRRLAARRLARALREAPGGDADADATVLHAYGGATWGLALEVGRELRAHVVLEVWRKGLASRAVDMVRKGETPVMLVAPDSTIEKALTLPDIAGSVRLIPWGVHSPPASRAVLRSGRAISIMMVGNGRDARAAAAALTGIASLCRKRDDILIFCDALAARRAGLFALAGELGIRDRLSLIDELENRRDLLLQGDVLVQPDATGEQRSVTLEAFAGGVLVVALNDPSVSSLLDGQTCVVVKNPDAASWETALGTLLSDPEKAQWLETSARRYVREHRRASEQVRQLLKLYEFILTGGSLPFPREQAGETVR